MSLYLSLCICMSFLSGYVSNEQQQQTLAWPVRYRVPHPESNCLLTSEVKEQNLNEPQSLLEQLPSRLSVYLGERTSGHPLNQKTLHKERIPFWGWLRGMQQFFFLFVFFEVFVFPIALPVALMLLRFLHEYILELPQTI